MSYFVVFNKENKVALTQTYDVQNFKILMKEFKSFNENFKIILNKLGSVENLIMASFPFKAGFNNTFVSQVDFFHACTVLRPFILINEKYYSKANNLIRNAFDIHKNSLLKKSFDEILPKELKLIDISSFMKINYKSEKIKDYCNNLSKDSRLYSFIQKNRIKEDTIVVSNYDFFDLYLNSYVFHRDQDFQFFIEEILGVKDFNLPTQENMQNYLLVNHLYSIVIQILQKVHFLDLLMSLVDRNMNYEETAMLQYFSKNDQMFPTINIKLL